MHPTPSAPLPVPAGTLRDRLRLHVLTDRDLARGRTDEELAAAALAGGATVIQLRDKRRGGRDLVAVSCRLAALCRDAGALFIVNDRVDVALAAGADGAHVGQDDLPAAAARRLLGPGHLLGVSVRSEEEALRAVEAGADYLGAGPVFGTATKADAGLAVGLERLAAICGLVPIPVVAIGGLSAGHAGAVLRAGAAGMAVISAVVAAPDVAQAARALSLALAAERGS